MALIGVGYFIEGIIYNFLHCYQYYPHFLDHDPIYDSNLGAVASNALALPVAATFIAAFRKNWVWMLSFTGLFIGVEWLFVKLSLYSHNWWRLEYTAMGLLFVYFPIAKVLNRLILQPLKGLWHFLLLFLIIGPILGTLHILPIMLFSNRYYDLGWFENLSQDTNALATIYYIMLSLLITIAAKFHWKYKWMKYAFVFICLRAVTMYLNMSGILHSLVWWDPYYYMIYPILVLMITVVISKRLSVGPS